jgi:L-ascorbate metabolism protein UlaG (beta-lactamase superfamily)
MFSDEVKIEYIGGPTALLEVAGIRFLTDPTFDNKGTDYKTSIYTLHKLADPVVDTDHIGKIDLVLLSHDHHFDNLDNHGREFLARAGKVLTTVAGAERLGGNAIGLQPWQTFEVPLKNGKIIAIIGTPCRHGPEHGDRGPVTGFVLNWKGDNDGAVYITGDTVWYEGVQEVAKRFNIRTVLAFLGAAKVKEVGVDHLTMTASEAVILAQHFNKAEIIPLHFEGWGHFTESRSEIERAFSNAGLSNHLHWASELATTT